MAQEQAHAVIKTNKWDIELTLYYDKVPMTATNFIALAERWFYNWLIFHRVIEDFMIQTWCPMGTWTWWPWYQFKDEFDSSLVHDVPGILSMANSWPDTNGSQFFITHTPTPWLDWVHSVFGRVIDQNSQDVVNKIQQWDIIEEIVINKDLIALSAKAQWFADQINQFMDQNK